MKCYRRFDKLAKRELTEVTLLVVTVVAAVVAANNVLRTTALLLILCITYAKV
jgi:hypothetical protein